MIADFEPFRKKLWEKTKWDLILGNPPAHLSIQYDQRGKLKIIVEGELKLDPKTLENYDGSSQ